MDPRVPMKFGVFRKKQKYLFTEQKGKKIKRNLFNMINLRKKVNKLTVKMKRKKKNNLFFTIKHQSETFRANRISKKSLL